MSCTSPGRSGAVVIGVRPELLTQLPEVQAVALGQAHIVIEVARDLLSQLRTQLLFEPTAAAGALALGAHLPHPIHNHPPKRKPGVEQPVIGRTPPPE